MGTRDRFTGIIAAALILAGMLALHMNYGYQIRYNGQTIGFVQDLKSVSSAFEELSEEFKDLYGEEIILDQQVKFEYEARNGRQIAQKEDLKAALLESGFRAQVEAARIYVNDAPMAVVDSVQTAEKILDEIIREGIVLSERDTLLEAEIMDDIRVEAALVDAWELEDQESVTKRFKEGLKKAETYEIKPKDTLWDIAVNRGMTPTQIQKANPDMDPARLMPGDTIVIEELESLFHIRYVKEVTTQESIPFEVERTKDETLYLGQEKVVKQGETGILETTRKKTFEDGIQVEDVFVDVREVKSPVTQLVGIGTKPWPVRTANGYFVVPATGRILGMFGSDRGSHYHQGVDICQWNGSARQVYAADAGTVVDVKTEGYNGGRGLYVVISHGNGLSTAYYHFASIQVVKGQTVSQGEQIGIMGTTGNSIGIHLHFEIRVNGTAVDPNNYFGYFRNGLDLRALSR